MKKLNTCTNWNAWQSPAKGLQVPVIVIGGLWRACVLNLKAPVIAIFLRSLTGRSPELPFGVRTTRDQCNMVLDRGPDPSTGRGETGWGRYPPHCNVQDVDIQPLISTVLVVPNRSSRFLVHDTLDGKAIRRCRNIPGKLNPQARVHACYRRTSRF